MESLKVTEMTILRSKIKKFEKQLNTIVYPEQRQILLTLICLYKGLYKFHTASSLYLRKSISRDVFIRKLKEVKIGYMDASSDLMDYCKENFDEGIYLKICNKIKKDYEGIEELEKII